MSKVNSPQKSPDFHSSVAAVVVTYQPDMAILHHLQRLLEQIPKIILVDNASSGEAAKWVESAAQMPGIFLIRNTSNLGIGTALNTGIRHALQSGYRWIATFDQDTVVPENYFDRLFRAYEQCPDFKTVGMIVPNGWTEIGGVVAAKKNSDMAAWSFVRGAVNSGSVIKTEIFEKTGFYDEALFIDYVDTDFCLRLQKYGFKILSATSVTLEHELGEKQTRNLFGFQISFRVHIAWRYYYNIRNRLLLYRRYFFVAPGWFFFDFRWLILELFRTFFLEHDRRPKIKAVFRGLKDGLRGRSGRHPNFPPGPIEKNIAVKEFSD